MSIFFFIEALIHGYYIQSCAHINPSWTFYKPIFNAAKDTGERGGAYCDVVEVIALTTFKPGPRQPGDGIDLLRGPGDLGG
jgi:hypothetical protein